MQRYLARISGPLLDRIDLHVEVPAVPYRSLSDERNGEPSERIRERVARAREVQLRRFGAYAGIFANAHMRSRHLRECGRLGGEAERLLRTAIERLGLSARAYGRILKVGRTIADLDGAGDIASAHIAEAIQYRGLDRVGVR